MRQVLPGESNEKRVQLRPLLLVKRGQKVVFEPRREPPGPGECLAPRGGHLDDVSASIGLVTLPDGRVLGNGPGRGPAAAPATP